MANCSTTRMSLPVEKEEEEEEGRSSRTPSSSGSGMEASATAAGARARAALAGGSAGSSSARSRAACSGEENSQFKSPRRPTFLNFFENPRRATCSLSPPLFFVSSLFSHHHTSRLSYQAKKPNQNKKNSTASTRSAPLAPPPPPPSPGPSYSSRSRPSSASSPSASTTPPSSAASRLASPRPSGSRTPREGRRTPRPSPGASPIARRSTAPRGQCSRSFPRSPAWPPSASEPTAASCCASGSLSAVRRSATSAPGSGALPAPSARRRGRSSCAGCGTGSGSGPTPSLRRGRRRSRRRGVTPALLMLRRSRPRCRRCPPRSFDKGGEKGQIFEGKEKSERTRVSSFFFFFFFCLSTSGKRQEDEKKLSLLAPLHVPFFFGRQRFSTLIGDQIAEKTTKHVLLL